jgi:tRNA(Arg) A34 adenosine deaminase TadA
MEEALALAHKAYEEGEIPVGALVVDQRPDHWKRLQPDRAAQ